MEPTLPLTTLPTLLLAIFWKVDIMAYSMLLSIAVAKVKSKTFIFRNCNFRTYTRNDKFVHIELDKFVLAG